MTNPIDFKWKKVGGGAYEALAIIAPRQSVLLTATKAMFGKYWFWSAQIHHDHDDLQEYVEVRLTTTTLAKAKECAENEAPRLIKTIKTLHDEVDQ